MRKWVISCILALSAKVCVCPGEQSIREFRAAAPEQLEGKVPVGYGHVFVQAGRQNNIDPVLLAAISAHESGRWKSKTARQKNNWMGLMTRSGAKSFRTPEESIYYAADLLNRKPFKGQNTLSQIAPIYCNKSPGHWKASVLQLEHEFAAWPPLTPKTNNISPVTGVQVGGYAENRGTDLYRLAKEKGLKGIISKRKMSTYRPGKGSPDWLKIK